MSHTLNNNDAIFSPENFKLDITDYQMFKQLNFTNAEYKHAFSSRNVLTKFMELNCKTDQEREQFQTALIRYIKDPESYSVAPTCFMDIFNVVIGLRGTGAKTANGYHAYVSACQARKVAIQAANEAWRQAVIQCKKAKAEWKDALKKELTTPAECITACNNWDEYVYNRRVTYQRLKASPAPNKADF